MPEATIIVIFTTSFVVALSGALMPGPLLAITIGESARHGFRAGPVIILGHGILELLVVIAIFGGLRQFIVTDLVTSIVGLMGGIILIGMGLIGVGKGKSEETMPAIRSANPGQDKVMVLSGILGSVSNPYWFIWWATIGMTYLLWSLKIGVAGVASFFGGHILADLAWYSAVAFIISSGRRAINVAVYRWLIMVCSLALIGLGGYFMVSGITFLMD